MADALPLSFPVPVESAIVSYPYQDIIEGSGNVNYAGIRVAVDATPANDVYALSIISNIIASTTGTAVTSAITLNFDIVFNTPKIVNGTGYIILPFQVDGVSFQLNPIFRVYHYDGSTETALTSAVTMEGRTSAGSPLFSERICKFSITNRNFKVGETLRLKLTFTNSGSGSAYVSHDPTGGNTNFVSTGGRLGLIIPFKLNT